MLSGVAGVAKNIFQTKYAPPATTTSRRIAIAIFLPVLFLGVGGTGAGLSVGFCGVPVWLAAGVGSPGGGETGGAGLGGALGAPFAGVTIGASSFSVMAAASLRPISERESIGSSLRIRRSHRLKPRRDCPCVHKAFHWPKSNPGLSVGETSVVRCRIAILSAARSTVAVETAHRLVFGISAPARLARLQRCRRLVVDILPALTLSRGCTCYPRTRVANNCRLAFPKRARW